MEVWRIMIIIYMTSCFTLCLSVCSLSCCSCVSLDLASACSLFFLFSSFFLSSACDLNSSFFLLAYRDYNMYSQTCIQLIAYLRLINSNIQFQSAMIHILLLPADILLENIMGRLIQWVKLWVPVDSVSEVTAYSS